ncbi:MAG: YbhB/YbcL family Raf kinase inhibitor-like protein [Gemmatimonadaceae bacterium]
MARSTQPTDIMKPPVLSIVLALLVGACGQGAPKGAKSSPALPAAPEAGSTQQTSQGSNTMSFKLTSSAFTEGGGIPSVYTCEGKDTSPPLSWTGAPAGTRSFAIIVDDPDAPDPAHPKMTYVHWVAYNIPATVSDLAEGAGKGAMPAGTSEGLNDWKKAEFGGPCPPIGTHRYFFKLSALDATLNLTRPTKPDLEKAMQGHVLGTAQLMGTYHKAK